MIARQILAGALAFAFTVALVPVVNALCVRWRLFDAPGPLKIHCQSIPRLGGIAIALAICAAAFLCAPHRAIHSWPFFAALALVWAAGLADDLRGLSPLVRLAAQFSAGALLWQHGWRLPVLGSGALNFTATAFYVAGFANSINLLDGMDGLAAGVVGIIAAAYIVLPGALISSFALAVAWSLAGACAGFLFFNWAPARAFMGDSSSTMLGSSIAFLGLDLYRSRPMSGSVLLFPLLIAALPLLDAVLAIIRRLHRGSSILAGDRGHLYDQLSREGWPVRRIALAFYGVTVALAAIGLYGVRSASPQFWVLATTGVGLLACVAIRLGFLRADDQNGRVPDSSSHPPAEEFGEPSQTN
jgi:UDP-GlcNAc:undecaprenyl-phosphate/decaprenyl-phosphate GlcNAc-1-phosphate transferase